MELPTTPHKWASQLTRIMNARDGDDRFPVDVETLAMDVSSHFFPDDCITLIKGRDISGFEGMLHRAPAGKTGWGIFYNSGIASQGRIRFTLAHEFGHYLLHRNAAPEEGFACNNRNTAQLEPKQKTQEREADEFATSLLMPLDDFRCQIGDRESPTIEQLSICSERYGVSLIALILRWLEYTQKRAVMVVSIEGFISWARSSERAYKTGAYFKTVNQDPIEIPDTSLAADHTVCDDPRLGMQLSKGSWFSEEESIHEMVVNSDQYDFTISLLLLSDFVDLSVTDDFDDEPVLAPLTF